MALGDVKREEFFSWYVTTNINRESLLYLMAFEQYYERDIFTLKKNDKVLYKYLQDNQLSLFDIDGILDKLLYYRCDIDAIKENIVCIVDYLKWSYGIDISYSNIDPNKYLVKTKNIITDPKETGTLRERVLSRNKGCIICGISNKKLNIVSHLKPKKDCIKEEINDINNVLLLCRNHDGLFDKGLITFDDNGNIIISNKLCNKDREKLGIDESVKIKMNESKKKYMKYHRDKIFKS